jgi:hypothetical protein
MLSKLVGSGAPLSRTVELLLTRCSRKDSMGETRASFQAGRRLFKITQTREMAAVRTRIRLLMADLVAQFS